MTALHNARLRLASIAIVTSPPDELEAVLRALGMKSPQTGDRAPQPDSAFWKDMGKGLLACPATLTERDRAFLTLMTPGLDGTELGRALLLQYAARLQVFQGAQSKALAGIRSEIHQSVARRHADENPIFTDADIQAALLARQA